MFKIKIKLRGKRKVRESINDVEFVNGLGTVQTPDRATANALTLKFIRDFGGEIVEDNRPPHVDPSQPTRPMVANGLILDQSPKGKQAEEVNRSAVIVGIINGLDPENDKFWKADGSPDLRAVSGLAAKAGALNVSRSEVEAIGIELVGLRERSRL